MDEFIAVEIEFDACMGIKECGQCVKVCPVNIFKAENGVPEIIVENEDECTLCELCLESCQPSVITIMKKYE